MKLKCFLGLLMTSFITVMSINAVFADESTPQLADGAYQIENADQLYWFANQVNTGKTNINAKLTADITINNSEAMNNLSAAKAWTPMGSLSSPYIGTFDGNKHIIKGLYTNGGYYQGLFGYMDKAEVKNLTIASSYIKGSNYVGSIAGRAKYSTVTSCSVTGKVEGEEYVGGICGYIDKESSNSKDFTTLISLVNDGSVSGERNVGGIAGYAHSVYSVGCYNYGDVTGLSDMGGIFGELAYASVIGCENDGNIIGKETSVVQSKAGGICGSYIQSTYNINGNTQGISMSCNKGKISGNINGIGGITGQIGASAIIGFCYNTGDIESKSATSSFNGGIAGQVNALQDASITNCYNIGSVNGSASTRAIVGNRPFPFGGVVNVQNCYFSEDSVSTDSYSDMIVKKGVISFRNGEVCYLLNAGTGDEKVFYYQTIGQDAYPVFSGEAVYYDAAKGYYNENAATYDGLGDVDNDGIVTSNDAALAYAMAESGGYDPKADANGDFYVTRADGDEIIKKVLRASDKFSAETSAA